MRSLLGALALCVVAGAAAPAAVQPYVLGGTDVLPVHARSLDRDYEIAVALPESYATSTRSYPVLFVTDADYGFPVARAIAQRLHKHAGLEETIVIGLSYAKGDSPVYSRRRDYTPTIPRAPAARPGIVASDMPGRKPAFGGAAAYGAFLVEEVFPLVATRYRADMRRKIFVGHSYGSLLGLQILLSHPDTFDHYILGSPSLWYDGGVLFDREAAYAKTHRSLPASVYFGIGGLERLPPGRKRVRAEESADMVADLRDFDTALKAHRYAGLNTRLEVFEGEDHASVLPLVLTHGLRAWLKKDR